MSWTHWARTDDGGRHDAAYVRHKNECKWHEKMSLDSLFLLHINYFLHDEINRPDQTRHTTHTHTQTLHWYKYILFMAKLFRIFAHDDLYNEKEKQRYHMYIVSLIILSAWGHVENEQNKNRQLFNVQFMQRKNGWELKLMTNNLAKTKSELSNMMGCDKFIAVLWWLQYDLRSHIRTAHTDRHADKTSYFSQPTYNNQPTLADTTHHPNNVRSGTTRHSQVVQTGNKTQKWHSIKKQQNAWLRFTVFRRLQMDRNSSVWFD